MDSKNLIHNYQCRKCSVIKQGKIIPSAYHCKSGSLHSWNDLGEKGVHQYACTKCETTLDSKSIPTADGCPTGNSHKWHLR